MPTPAKLFIKEEYFHHHAFEIVNTHKVIKGFFSDKLNSRIQVEERVKQTRGISSKAIKADFLNKELRRVLTLENTAVDLKLEVSEERGVFYFASEKNSIGGFDFAIINHEQNLISLRNLCFGQLRYNDGERRWNRFLDKNPELREFEKKVLELGLAGTDIEYSRQLNDFPLIVGEIQFGNWALAYRDFFKVLKANVQNSIDCLVYIVPTGNLESQLSDGIVTFDKTKEILKEFQKVISVPVWLIGLDMK